MSSIRISIAIACLSPMILHALPSGPRPDMNPLRFVQLDEEVLENIQARLPTESQIVAGKKVIHKDKIYYRVKYFANGNPQLAAFDDNYQTAIDPASEIVPTTADPFELSVPQIRRILEQPSANELIFSADLNFANKTTITSALQIHNFDTYMLPYTDRRGYGIGVWQTEVTCAPSFHSIPGTYLPLSGNGTGTDAVHSWQVAEVLKAAAPDVSVYCKCNGTTGELPSLSEVTGLYGDQVYLLNQSMAVYNVSAYAAEAQALDNFVYNLHVLPFLGAGNDGNAVEVDTPSVALNSVSVGAFDDRGFSVTSFTPFRH